MEDLTNENLSRGVKSENAQNYPSYHVNKKGTKYIMRVTDSTAYEKRPGSQPKHANYGSKELLDIRLKDYTECTKEEYLNAP